MSVRLQQWRAIALPARAAVCLLVATLAGCAPQGREAPDEPSATTRDGQPELLPVPPPDISRLDPAARAVLGERRAELDATILRGQAGAQVLSAAYGDMGMLYHAYQLLETAEPCYRNAQLLAPESFRWPYYLGHLYGAKNAVERAIRSFERALEIDPDHLPARVEIGRWQLERNLLDEAQHSFGRALGQDEFCAAAMVGLGRIAASRGQYEEAVDLFEAALEIGPEASSIHYHLGMAYRDLGMTEQAEEHLSQRGVVKAAVQDPLMRELRFLVVGARPYTDRGIIAAHAGRYDEAVREFRRAVEMEPGNPTHLLHLAMALRELGDTPEVVRVYREVLRLSPKHERAHLALAELLANQGDDREAGRHFRQALESNPNLRTATLGLAKTLQRLDQHGEALVYYQETLRMDPSNPEARLGRVFASIKLGRYAEARSALEEDVAVLPEQPAFRHALARLLAACPDDRVRDGRRSLELVQELAEELRTADLAETFAMALAEQGWFREAIDLQQQAIAVATEARRDVLVRRMRRNLTLYENGEPCREPWEEDDAVFRPAPAPFGSEEARTVQQGAATAGTGS